jgi:hypothetical protein
MSKHFRWFLIVLIACLLARQSAAGADAPQVPTVAEKTAGMEKFAGYFNLYWDVKQGKLWLEIDKWNTQFLYQSGLPAGMGSNDIGLDRGQLGATRIVRFERQRAKGPAHPGKSGVPCGQQRRR